MRDRKRSCEEKGGGNHCSRKHMRPSLSSCCTCSDSEGEEVSWDGGESHSACQDSGVRVRHPAKQT